MAKQTDWECWVLAHGPGLLLFARQRSRCEADAQDLVQEALVEAWLRQGDGAPPPLALVFATIRRLKEAGMTLLLVEQMAKRALEVADYAYVMERGRIVLEGAAGDLLKNDKVRRAYLGVE